MRVLISVLLVLLSSQSALAVKPVEVLESNPTYATSAADVTIIKEPIIDTTIANIMLFEQLRYQADSDVSKQEQIATLIKDQRELIPALNDTGLFQVFEIDEWLNDVKKEGRILVATLYLQKYPKLITPKIYTQIGKLQSGVSKELKPLLRETLETYKKNK